MPLHYRRRGEVWHARGRVRVGTQTVDVQEFSTGALTRADAEAIGAALCRATIWMAISDNQDDVW